MNKSKYFGIPMVTKGKMLEVSEEDRKVRIIENQLMAATKGIKCCVFRDGKYSIIDNYDNTYNVILTSNGSSLPLEGMINGGYVRTEDDIIWDQLIKGKIYYLYLQWKDGMYENPSSFTIISSESLKRNDKTLLLAKVDLTTEPTIDTNPDNKIYNSDLAQHILDTKDPHGETLEQTKINAQQINIETKDDTIVGGLLKFINKRTTNKEIIEVEGEFIVKDSCGELKTNSKSIVGAINELDDMIKALEK